MIKAVLFDFDGTLIDTNELIFKSYRTAFRKVLNREIDDEEILKLYGRPLRGSLMEYGEPGEMLYTVYREFNEAQHDLLAKPFEGVQEGLEEINKKGYKMGIVTSKRMPLVERGLELLGISAFFDVVITLEDTSKGKPDPEPLLLGCTKLSVLPEEAIYVGDSIFDMEAAKNADCKLCAVKYTLTDHKKILSYNPDFFVETIKELADYLEEVD
ncbi:MAG: pyrophosphatase PpaX [Clostridia bacterium]|nr:pyrophosphatase PpaX [Clostridia bacterium]